MAAKCETGDVPKVDFAILSGNKPFPVSVAQNETSPNGRVNHTPTMSVERKPFEVRTPVTPIVRRNNGFTNGVRSI